MARTFKSNSSAAHFLHVGVAVLAMVAIAIMIAML